MQCQRPGASGRSGKVGISNFGGGLSWGGTPLGIGVFHGHQPLSDAMTITRSVENVVHEIDGRPAWDVFVEKTRDRALQDGIDPAALKSSSDILQYFLKYETGIKTGPEFRIRMPLVRNDDGSLGVSSIDSVDRVSTRRSRSQGGRVHTDIQLRSRPNSSSPSRLPERSVAALWLLVDMGVSVTCW